MFKDLVTRKAELEAKLPSERGQEYLEVLERIDFYVAWQESVARGEEPDFLTEL